MLRRNEVLRRFCLLLASTVTGMRYDVCRSYLSISCILSDGVMRSRLRRHDVCRSCLSFSCIRGLRVCIFPRSYSSISGIRGVGIQRNLPYVSNPPLCFAFVSMQQHW